MASPENFIVVDNQAQVVSVNSENENTVAIESEVIYILTLGSQGIPGAQGENGADGRDAHEAEMIEDPLAYYILSKN